MDTHCTHIGYRETRSFSPLVYDYIATADTLSPFYIFTPDAAGIAAAIKDRSNYPVDRQALVQVLQEQYRDVPEIAIVNENIQSLLHENTFTVCTAHQPNLLTGYLYFIYKILHAVKLAEELNQAYPGKHFVPVYYMGSEDNDLEELGRFRYRGKKYTWDADGQTGAVGRMNTASLKTLLAELFRKFGPPGTDNDTLEQLIKDAYLGHKTIAAATRYLVHSLMGRYGLVVLDPDHAGLKKQFIQVMQDDLLNHTALPLAQAQSAALEAHYKAQAYPRAINLFYLKDNVRERIEHEGATWKVVNTDITWDKDTLLAELKEHPERFSPNVILRGLFQETILPDVAFIGGGAEVAYWLQLLPVFQHYKVFYPVVLLRQSVQWISSSATRLMDLLEFDETRIFSTQDELIAQVVARNTNSDWTTDKEQEQISAVIASLQQKAIAIDPTLELAAAAVLQKVTRQLQVLQQKMYRNEKKKSAVEVERISRLKEMIFPGGGLQERVDNFMEYYQERGEAFFDLLKDNIRPLDNKFLVLTDRSQ